MNKRIKFTLGIAGLIASLALFYLFLRFLNTSVDFLIKSEPTFAYYIFVGLIVYLLISIIFTVKKLRAFRKNGWKMTLNEYRTIPKEEKAAFIRKLRLHKKIVPPILVIFVSIIFGLAYLAFQA
jgi:uncharacterized membrane protein YhaH (DUF805 family)